MSEQTNKLTQSKELDPFWISKVMVQYFDEGGCMYEILTYGNNFQKAPETSTELEEMLIRNHKLSDETSSLKVVTVYGYEGNGVRDRPTAIELEIERLEAQRDAMGVDDPLVQDEADFMEKEEECWSFFLDHRRNDGTK